MTSNRCSKGYHPVAGFFAGTLKRQVAITLLFTGFLLLLCPGLILPQVLQYQKQLIDFEYQLCDWPTIIFMLSVVLGIILLCHNNMHLFSRRSADMYYSLPIKRNTLLLTRFTASAVGAAFAMTLSFGGLMLLNALPNVLGVGVGQLLKVYFLMLLFLLLCLSVTLILLVNSGGVFHFIFSLFTVCGGLPLLALIAYGWYNEAATGVTDGGAWLKYVSPLYYAGFRLVNMAEDRVGGRMILSLEPVLLSIGGTILFGGIALLMNRRRKTECSGEGFAYSAAPVLITLIASSLCAYVVGILFQTNYDTYSWDFWLPFSVGAVIFAVAAGAIVSKGFRRVWRWFICAGVATVLLFGTYQGATELGKNDLRRIPNSWDIASITMEGDYDSPEVILTKDFDVVLKFHTYMSSENSDNGSSPYFNSALLDSYVTFTYELHSGETITRSYTVTDYQGMCRLLDIVQTKEYTAAWETLLNSQGVSSVEINARNNVTSKSTGNTVTADQIRELLRVYGEEMRFAPSSVLECDKEYVRVTIEGKETSYLTVPFSFDRTLALLDELLK